MSSISTFLPACLFCSGMASISWGVTRFPDTGFKTLGAALLVAGLSLSASPALADQFVEAADNAKIDCTLSRDELTRIALVGDEFSSVSKIASGYPYNDFAVTHEPVRGDIYISVPQSYASESVSFFATSKQGFVYKFACHTAAVEAHQLFITNPALAKPAAETWETGQSEEQTIIGARFNAQQFILANRGKKPVDLNEAELAPKSARAISFAQNTLGAGTSTSAFVVTATQGAKQ